MHRLCTIRVPNLPYLILPSHVCMRVHTHTRVRASVCTRAPTYNPITRYGSMEVSKKPANLRDQMPETAIFVDAKRKELGAEYVNGCIKAALAGKPGRFYAMENGHVLGTPFPATHPIDQDQRFALLTGCTFAAFIAQPNTP